MRRRIFVAAMAAAVLGGCATVGLGGFKQPLVQFSDVKIRGLGLSGGALDIVLSVYNPNGYNLNATRLTYRLMVEDKELGNGVLDHAFRVRGRDSTFVTIPMDFTYAGLGAAGRQLLSSGSVNYRVMGDIGVDAGAAGTFTVPYDQRGRFSSFGGTSQQRR
ncbi:MAG TPA: LEA type 2 family protein [Gemmatimonadaceae bacterium]|jgi:LEA14-like dessication related protein|nr:LEA type 2 family protein [Gemmatimonadaceae bacterium]